MANIAELERVLTYITDHPEQHRQNRWTCETGGCLAGHACLLNGYEKYVLQNLDGSGYAVANGTVVSSDGIYYDVQSLARDIFDIDMYTAQVLFASTNTRDKLALMVKDLANGEELRDTWNPLHDDSLRDDIWVRKGMCVDEQD